MVEMIWKEPSPAVSSEKLAVLAELRKNPGRWALVQRAMASSSATAPWLKLGCEAVYRKSEDQPKKYDVYARWPEPKKPILSKPDGTFSRGGVSLAGPGMYDPGIGRAARGVPEDGLPVESLRR